MKLQHSATFVAALLVTAPAFANTYQIDTAGAHASVNFKVKHLGYSWLTGRFNQFDGQFTYDAAKPEAASIQVTIDTTSLDSNHAERDKHLKSKDFIDAGKFPKATFSSTKVVAQGPGQLLVTGELTLHGVTQSLTFPVNKIGEGKDPWGGYRAGFSAQLELPLKDFNINTVGDSSHVTLDIHFEGIKQ